MNIRRLASVAAAAMIGLSLCAFIPFAAFAAEGGETSYKIDGYNNDTTKVKENGNYEYNAEDEFGNKIGQWLYCSDFEKGTPKTTGTRATTFTRHKLSEFARFDDKTKARILTLLLENDTILDLASQKAQADGNQALAVVIDQHLNTPAGWQAFIWASKLEDETMNKTFGEEIRVLVKNNGLPNSEDYVYENAIKPILDILDSESAKYSFNEYDAYIYTPENDAIQELIGAAYKKEASEVSITKRVVDADGKSYDFNGVDDSKGFEFTVTIKDLTAGRLWANEDVILTVTDKDGNTNAPSTVKTNTQGQVTFRLDKDSTMTISGFEHRNFEFTIVESDDNMGEKCSFESVSGSASSTTFNLQADPASKVDVNNKVTTPTPTATPSPVPTATEAPNATPTATEAPTATPTAVPTATPVPTATEAPTVTPTVVPTATPEVTVSATATPVPTATTAPTATPAPSISTYAAKNTNDTASSPNKKTDNTITSAVTDSTPTPTPVPPTATPTPTSAPNRSNTVSTGEKSNVSPRSCRRRSHRFKTQAQEKELTV